MTYQLQETTLYQEFGNFIARKLGGNAAPLPKIAGTRKTPDILWSTGQYQIIFEEKIGEGLTSLPNAIAQAADYKSEAGADGYAVFIYPPIVRQYIKDSSDIPVIVETVPFMFYCQAPFLHDYIESVTLPELTVLLQKKLREPTRAPAIGLVVRALGDTVRALSQLFKRKKGLTQAVINEVVGNFELFSILAEAKEVEDEEELQRLESAAAELACYVLVNQLLLYRLLTEPLGLPKFPGITTIDELVDHFEQVRQIDYRAIYNIRVAEKFHASIVPEVNKVLQTINLLEPELVPHDLLGRVFHELLPFETRKQLGAFYTKPVAAEILAQIGIRGSKRRVLDPSCGSGTLLVAAYHRLRELHADIIHRDLVEELLNGVDIMPFAAHMTALNLTLQAVKERTNEIRVGVGNALDLGPEAPVRNLRSWTRARVLFEDRAKGVDIDSGESVPEFMLPKEVDAVIMNPPFTRKQRLKGDMWGKQKSFFTNAQHYWAYFLSLANSILRQEGSIAAVLPRDCVRGEYSAEVRNWLLNSAGYSLEYIVKSLAEVAFSEHAAFRDYLLVLKKGHIDHCGVVYLKKSLNAMTLDSARDIGRKIASVPRSIPSEDDDFSVHWVPQRQVKGSADDLWPLVAFSSPRNAEIVLRFTEQFVKTHPSVVKLRELPKGLITRIVEGWKIRPLMSRDALFLVRPLHKRRAGPKSLLVEDETNSHVHVRIPFPVEKGAKESDALAIPLSHLVPALRTHSYFPSMKLGQNCDYFTASPYKEFSCIFCFYTEDSIDFEQLRASVDRRLARLLVPRRLNISAPGVSLVAFWEPRLVMAPDTIHCIHTTSEQWERAFCVWLNSVVGVTDLLVRRTETEGSYCNIEQKELPYFHAPVPNTALTANLDSIFFKVCETHFPSLLTQFTERFPARVEMDTEVLRAMGYSEGEAKAIIDELYPVIADELTQMKQAMSGR